MKIKLSIIIVNYKVKEFLFSCISSIRKTKNSIAYEVIVVDNDEKKTIETDLKNKFPEVRYVKSTKNEGYGGGNNLGAKYARGDYIFFLNPDTIIFSDTINELCSFLDKNPQADIVAPLLYDSKGEIFKLQGAKELTPWRAIFVLSFINKLFPKNPISQDYWLYAWDKKTIHEVDTAPGTAFVIRKNIFEKLGGFDKKFFLYFEEFDLCKRVRNQGQKIYIIPSAKVMHSWGESTKRSERNIKNIFFQSRHYYFKKHYGALFAILVDLFTSIGKETLFLFLIVALGIFLRIYRLEQNFGFDGEVGDNLLDIKNAFINRQIPLLGPPTSHPWLFFGPLFYWIYGPILYLSKFNPLSHAYFGAFISILTIIFNYFFIKNIFSKRIAFISTFLITVSPLYLQTSRLGRFTFIVALLIYPFLWMLKKLLTGEKKYIFWIFFLIGLMLNFHYTPIFLIPVLLTLILLKKINLKPVNALAAVFGLAIPISPLVLYDSLHRFSMSINLFLWIPYRILGFLNLYHKNNLNQFVLREDTLSFINFFSYSFTPTEYNSFSFLGITISLVLLGFVFLKIYAFIKEKEIDLDWMIFLIWGFWGFLALFVHGSAPLHYYVPLLPFPILLLSLFLDNAWQALKKYGRFFIILFLFLTGFINLTYYFSSGWFYSKNSTNYVSYSDRQKISQFIVKDAMNKPFQLKRIGYNDMFRKQFAQNYIYLLWYYGNEPVDKAKITYTIIEDKSFFNEKKTKFSYKFNINNAIILKN